MAKMSVDDKLGLDLFHTDEHNPHITVNEDYDDMEEIRKVLLARGMPGVRHLPRALHRQGRQELGSPHGRRRCSVPSGLMLLQKHHRSAVNN